MSKTSDLLLLVLGFVTSFLRCLPAAFKFEGVDFIQLTGCCGDELLSRDTTRRFVEDNVIPIIEQCNRDGRFRASW